MTGRRGLIVVCLLIAGSVFCLGQQSAAANRTILIRALSGKTGRPMRNLSLLYYTKVPVDKYLTVRTDKNGEARIDASGFPAFGIDSGSDRFDCRGPSYPMIQVQTVLATGVVGENHCGTPTSSRTPGVVVLFVHKLTLSERLRIFFDM